MGLESAGLFPIPESAQTMYRSVEWYWKALKEVGAAFKDYKPCDGQLGYGKGNHHSSCGYEKCLGDFGLLTKAKHTLTKYGQKEVMNELLGVSLRWTSSPASLTTPGNTPVTLLLSLTEESCCLCNLCWDLQVLTWRQNRGWLLEIHRGYRASRAVRRAYTRTRAVEADRFHQISASTKAAFRID
jgi:hypothetical protein